MPFRISPGQGIRLRDGGVNLVVSHSADPAVAVLMSISYAAIERRARRKLSREEAGDIVSKNISYFLPVADRLQLQGRRVGDDGISRIAAEDLE